MTEQDREYIRLLYAGIAMMKMNWRVGDDKVDAEDCFRIADAMLDAAEPPQEGIVSVKKRRSSK